MLKNEAGGDEKHRFCFYLALYLKIILRGRAGYELVLIISYPVSPSRIIVLLKHKCQRLFCVDFIPVQNDLLAIFSQSCKNVDGSLYC